MSSYVIINPAEFSFLKPTCNYTYMFKGIVEINEYQPNDKQRLFNQSLGEQGSEPPLLAFGRNSKACKGVRKLYSGKKRKSLDMP